MSFIFQCRQIEELTQYINTCELKINDLFDEVEELRERLGLDPKEPIDLGEFRKKKSVRTQEEKALNQVALTLGLSVNDVVAVDSFIDDLKSKKTSGFSTSAQIKTATEIKELKLRVSVSTTNGHRHMAPSLSVVTAPCYIFIFCGPTASDHVTVDRPLLVLSASHGTLN
ncbi:hypothetical protein NP493_585g00005 [Ridgeia piscesae]|uniref:Uncharacterized protein n=1 Tax=Ridgeia piscesae TaxID=27915 RepID=A0AAD9KUR5_RIDPI|nr:hypothetical protein NP493_585g00005 [Ridgeia piscesae]